ncbi:MAG: aldolase/citrate lyase family protein [Chloroflexota bacterium]|nr:aldolase/citrate lyase family protein [Chloroflexota bacterium]
MKKGPGLVSSPIKQAFADGRVVIGTMIVQVRAPAIIQLLANYGLEFVFLDMEHGPYNLETAADLIQVARLAGITPLVRVPDTQYHMYARLLDAGAQGIMTPRVECADQVRQIMRYSKYPPMGQRGFSRLAAHVDFAEIDFREYVRWANDNLLNFIQIESKAGVEALPEMIAVPGIDGVVIGMDDLALSLGVAGNTKDPLAEHMLERIVATCEAHTMPWGLHLPDTERLVHWIERGMMIATFSSDIWMFQEVLQEGMQKLRAAAAPGETGQPDS